jgi:hypothetical protein
MVNKGQNGKLENGFKDLEGGKNVVGFSDFWCFGSMAELGDF